MSILNIDDNRGGKMTENIDKKYLKEAAKNLKGIYEKLGHSPTAAEYDRIAETQFKLRSLYKNNIKLNQLKEAAGVPKRKSGNNTGKQKGDKRPDIFCPAYNGKMAAADYMPGYRKDICKNCEHKQENNVKAIPDIPEEVEQSQKYDTPSGNKHMNGNDVYLTDIGIISIKN